MSKSYHTAVTKCPNCGKRIDAAMCVGKENQAPKAGDVTVCLYCAEVLMFRKNQTVFKPNAQQLIEIQLGTCWPLVQRARAVVKDFDWTKRHPKGTQ